MSNRQTSRPSSPPAFLQDQPTQDPTGPLQEVVDAHLGYEASGEAEERLPGITEARRKRSLQEIAISKDALIDEINELSHQDAESETVLYLAYGSNMCAKTFKGVRGIKPLAKTNVVVPELRLTFDLPGIPYLEPCFANVAYRRGESQASPGTVNDKEKDPLVPARHLPGYRKDRWKKGLVGVVYEITKNDFAKIIKSEGGGASYQNVLTTCHPLEDGQGVPLVPITAPFKAYTLYSPGAQATASAGTQPLRSDGLHRIDPGYAQASARYLKLLTDGSWEQGLPSEYRSYLQGIRPYRITSFRQRIGKYLFAGLWAPAVMTVFAGAKLFADKTGKSPAWIVASTMLMFRVAWSSYDVFFCPVFGDGERTIEDREDEIQKEEMEEGTMYYTP
ncbi:MAG: hypothetical protein M1833_006477 [Piccolia ochrophora]|nr:MAG: hypothetical protein M1833_006477 [Piccolia ochrophora]